MERAGFERVHSVARHGAAFFRALKARTQCGNKRSRGGRGKGVARRYHTFAEQSHAKPLDLSRSRNESNPSNSFSLLSNSFRSNDVVNVMRDDGSRFDRHRVCVTLSFILFFPFDEAVLLDVYSIQQIRELPIISYLQSVLKKKRKLGF